LSVSGVLFTSELLCNTGFDEAHQWAQAHFLFEAVAGGLRLAKSLIFMALDIEHVRGIVARVAASRGLEVVEVEFRGGGKSRMLRVFIDKPGGVSHEDCANVSHEVGTILDVEDAVPGGSYLLEVSSPGLDRKLVGPADYQRFTGSVVKVMTREPVDGGRHFQGRLETFQDGRLTLDLSASRKSTKKGSRPGPPTPQRIDIELGNIERANLVPEI
jgi:ribosome maturation factor RimP